MVDAPSRKFGVVPPISSVVPAASVASFMTGFIYFSPPYLSIIIFFFIILFSIDFFSVIVFFFKKTECSIRWPFAPVARGHFS